jgi:hypothetical protein
MATVRIVLVPYACFPKQLFESVEKSRHDIRWYIFFHGHDLNVFKRLAEFVNASNTAFHPYGVNRGLARSWNDGIRLFRREGGDILLILNDDPFFYDGAFDEYVDFILSTKGSVPDFGLISVLGLETGPGDVADFGDALVIGSGAALGTSLSQALSCAAIGEAAIAKVGYFDQNFWPAYLEDNDYARRLGLAGLPHLGDTRTLLEHNRSLTLRSGFRLRQRHTERWKRTREYYLRKWGGFPGSERFASPFDDPSHDYFIPADRTEAPYGPEYDRADLAASATAGMMQGE